MRKLLIVGCLTIFLATAAGASDVRVGKTADVVNSKGRYRFNDRGIHLSHGGGAAWSSVKIASGTGGGPTLANSDFFGTSVDLIGDLNANGVPDIVVGAYADDTGGSGRGAAHILFMNAAGTVASSVKIASATNGGPTLTNDDGFGIGVAGIEDLNADGIPDLVVGTSGDDTGGTDRGAAYVLFMNADGTAASSVKIASGTNGGPTLTNGDNFGRYSAGIGDLNADGIPDIAVSAYGDDTGGTDRGAVYILFMNTNGTVASSVKIASATNGGPTLTNSDFFGTSLSGIGDLNADGIPDLGVGAGYDDTGGTDRGAAYILFMNAAGTVASSVKIASATNGGPTLTNDDAFGSGVAGIGDLNADGIPDLVVGTFGDDTGGNGRGAAYVLFMNAAGTVASSVKIASATNGGPTLTNEDYFAISLAGIGDLDTDGIPDIVVGAYNDDTGGTDRGAAYVLPMAALSSLWMSKFGVNRSLANLQALGVADAAWIGGNLRIGNSANGCLLSATGGTITGTCESDEVLKDVQGELNPVLPHVDALVPSYFTWDKQDPRNAGKGDDVQLGLTAQQVESAYPELVVEDGGTKFLRYERLPFYALRGVAELHARIEALQAQVDTMSVALSLPTSTPTPTSVPFTPTPDKAKQTPVDIGGDVIIP